MNADRIIHFLKLVGIPEPHDAGKWVRGSCPFAWSRHKGGKDDNPSFGVHVEDVGVSRFNCWSCNTKGTLDALLAELLHDKQAHGKLPKNIRLADAYAFLEDENSKGFIPADEWAEVLDNEDTEFFPWPEWYLEEFPSALTPGPGLFYLRKGRKQPVSDAMIGRWDLRIDPEHGRVCTPFRTFEGELAGMRGRSLENKHYHDYKYNEHSNAGLVWYGEHLVDRSRPVVLCEGAFDAINVSRVYRNVMANLSTGLTSTKIEALRYFPRVVVFFDNDMAGAKAAFLITEKLGADACRVEYPRESWHDPGDMTLAVLREHLRDIVHLDTPIL